MGSNGYISASGATAQLRDLDVVSNNLANMGTPGFKRGESVFRAVLEGALRDERGDVLSGVASTAYVSTDLVGTDFTRGASERTGSLLHAMIDGPGFFEVETEQGLRYTRAGNFIVDREGRLATPNGDPVMGEGGPIQIADGEARIEPTGAIVDREGNPLARLKVVEFADPQALVKEGQGLFSPGEGAGGRPVERAQLIPESIEGSNVEAAKELALLVILQRAFESNVRAMQADDESTQTLIEGMR